MVLGTKKNVIVGAALLFVGPPLTNSDVELATPIVDEEHRPIPEAATSYAVTLDGDTRFRNVGYTQEGVEVSYEPEFGDVEVDQVMDSVRTFKTGMRVTLNTTIAEATLENLILVWGQADATITTGSGEAQVAVQSGELGQAPLERSLFVVGNGTEGEFGYNERTYVASRALSVESSSHSLRRAEATVFPVSFRLLPADDGDYGVIHDRDRTSTWATL